MPLITPRRYEAIGKGGITFGDEEGLMAISMGIDDGSTTFFSSMVFDRDTIEKIVKVWQHWLDATNPQQ